MGEVRRLLDSMSREELLSHLREAGFNVTEGTGKITYSDVTCEDCGEKGVQVLNAKNGTDKVECMSCKHIFFIR